MRSVTEPVDYKLKTTIFAEIYITRPERSEIYATKEKRMLCGGKFKGKGRRPDHVTGTRSM